MITTCLAMALATHQSGGSSLHVLLPVLPAGATVVAACVAWEAGKRNRETPLYKLRADLSDSKQKLTNWPVPAGNVQSLDDGKQNLIDSIVDLEKLVTEAKEMYDRREIRGEAIKHSFIAGWLVAVAFYLVAGVSSLHYTNAHGAFLNVYPGLWLVVGFMAGVIPVWRISNKQWSL